MLNRDNRFFVGLNIAIDAILIVAAYYLAVFVRFFVMHGSISLEIWEFPYLLMAVCYALVVTGLYNVLGLYRIHRRKKESKMLKMLMVNLFCRVLLTLLQFLMMEFLYWITNNLKRSSKV